MPVKIFKSHDQEKIEKVCSDFMMSDKCTDYARQHAFSMTADGHGKVFAVELWWQDKPKTTRKSVAKKTTASEKSTATKKTTARKRAEK